MFNINKSKITNQNFELYKENGEHYLKIDFECEDDYGIYKGRIYKINFDLSLKNVITESKSTINGVRRDVKVSLSQPKRGYEKILSFDVLENSKGNYFELNLVEEKIQEVTMEEIEKKFGHKIKVVSK